MNSVLENDFVKALAMVIKLDGKKKNIKQHVEMAYKDLNTKVDDWDKNIYIIPQKALQFHHEEQRKYFNM